MLKWNWVMACVLLISLVFNGWSWQKLEQERQRNHELLARLTTPPSPQRYQAEPPAASIPKAPAAQYAAKASSNPTPIKDAREEAMAMDVTQTGWRHDQKRLVEDPKFQEAWRTQRRLHYSTRRDNSIRLLGMSPEQADAAIELALDQELRMQSPGQTGESVVENQRQYYAEVRRLLGDAKFDRWQEYMASRPSRTEVDEFRAQLADADPLREDQVEPLIAALHVEYSQVEEAMREVWTSTHRSGIAASDLKRITDRQLELRRSANARALTTAAAILSPAQLQRLKTKMERDVAQIAAQSTLIQLRAEQAQSETSVSKAN